MFSLFKNLFQPKPASAPPASVATTHPAAANFAARLTAEAVAARLSVEPVVVVPKVEIASLQLAAILAKFPEELKKLVLMPPAASAMVTLPMPTVLKYLPTGSVKMSLASVVRQAPAGTFAPLPAHDKRMVEVPLAEIFKRVNPTILKTRDDQRLTELAEGDVDIFGDEHNPRALTPRFESTVADESTLESPPVELQPTTIKMPALEETPTLDTASLPAVEVAVPERKIAATFSIPRESRAIPDMLTAPISREPTAPATASTDAEVPLIVPIRELISAWPEPFKTEASSLDGALVALPSGRVSAGLARGKVIFSWNEIRKWITPAPAESTAGDGEANLTLPLRVLAPAFLNLSRPANGKAKPVGIDESIPDLFSGERNAAVSQTTSAAPAPAPVLPLEVPPAKSILTLEAPAVEPDPEPEPAALAFRFAEEDHVPPAAIEEPGTVLILEDTPAPSEAAPASEIAAEQSRLAGMFDAEAVNGANQRTLGDVFGQPQKATWSPKEIVDGLIQLPAIDGAIVALHEGLVVAHHLPDGMRGEIFAAFLPQIFGRLSQYGAEMKLGDVEEVTVRAGGRDCRFFRMETVYFGVLAQPTSAVPASDLRLCAAGLANT